MIELLTIEFSALITLPIGAFFGIVAVYLINESINDISPLAQHVLHGYVASGLTGLLLLGIRYLNIGREILTTMKVIGISLTIPAIVPLGLLIADR